MTAPSNAKVHRARPTALTGEDCLSCAGSGATARWTPHCDMPLESLEAERLSTTGNRCDGHNVTLDAIDHPVIVHHELADRLVGPDYLSSHSATCGSTCSWGP
jgi:hypothetical protein